MTTETVEAALVIELNVTCPHCDHYFDLVSETGLNDEGGLFNQVLSDERWKVDASERLSCAVNCPECKQKINIKGVAW